MKLALVTLPLVLTGLGSVLLRAADESILFSDDFATLRPGWGEADESQSVSDNKMVLNLKPNRIRHSLYDGNLVGNADIRLKVSQTRGNPDQLGGIAFWATDDNNFYIARVSADGRFSVGRAMNGKWLSPVFGQPRDEVSQGLGQTNELRVVTCGRMATVYVNEKQVVEFQGFPPKGESMFGVYAESGDDPALWAFSELVVRQGPPAPEAQGPRDDSLLLTDDFATLDPAWGRAVDSMKVHDHKLVVSLEPEAGQTTLYSGSLFDDADIRLKIAEVKGGTDQTAGIVFWASDFNNYYTALIQADGGFYVARRMRGKWMTPVTFRVSEEVRKGSGQVNELRVATGGPTATIYVNDQKLISFQGYPPSGGAKIGLRAESGAAPVTWAFSELRVRQGTTPPPAIAAPADHALLLADDFLTLEPAWGLASEVKSVRDKKLWINLGPGMNHTSLYQGTLFDDVDLSVKVAAAKGWTDQLPGLVFWANGVKDYCAFVINPQGDIYAGRILEGKWKGMNILKSTKSKLRMGAGEVNELRVVTTGNIAILDINGQKVYTYKGESPEGGSRIGLRVETNSDPAACGFSEFRVRTPLVTLETSGSRADGLLLTDDFRALQPNWGPADEYQSVSDHQLLLNPKPKGSRTNFYSGNFGNADIRVKVAQIKGAPEMGGGVAFWAADIQNYYMALLRSDGNFCVIRYISGLYLQPVPLKLRDEVRQGVGQINTLRVVTSGRTASVYVNDQQVTSFRGFPPKGGGWTGFFAESGAERSTWAFSELNVRKGPDSPDDKTPADDTLLFADDFSVLDPGWGNTENWLSASENKLVVSPKPKSGYTSLYGGRFFGDADIRVKISLTAGGADAPAGIVFWATNDGNKFLATIRADGRIDIFRNAGGKFSPVVPSKVLDEVLKGTDKVNELRVLLQGKTATVYVNEKKAGAIETDTLPEVGSKIGLFAESGSEAYSWTFSDLVVRKPQ